MLGRRPAVWILIVSATFGVGTSVRPIAAEAQTLRPVLRDDSEPLPRLKPRAQPTRPATPPAEADVVPQRSRLRPTASDQPVEGVPADEVDFDQAPTGVRPAVRDGDLGVQLEPEPITDGAGDEPDVYRNPDGQDPVQWDSRLSQDSDAFERPPAGYDRGVFGVELAPIDDRRPLQLFRFEPWQPRGVRLGSFTLFPQADIGGAYVSNLFRTKPARSDQALEFRPGLRAVSNWQAHALELRATGGFSFFDTYPNEGDRAYTLEARGRLDVTRQTQVAGRVLRDVAQESRGSLESRLRGGARADVTTDEARLQLDHRFNRLAVQVRGVAQTRTYEDTALTDGGTLSNRDRNLRNTEQAMRLSWTFKPTFIGFAEAGINQRRFEAAAISDGIKRDSDGERYRMGIGFGNTGQMLRGEASLGYGRQTPLDQRLGQIDGMLLDANAAWRITSLTALLLRASTDVVETTSLASPGGFVRRVQAELRHAFLRPLIGTASAGFSTTKYQGILINENLTELALGLEYYLAPQAVLYARYLHTSLQTTAPTGGFDNDEIRVGLRIRQ